MAAAPRTGRKTQLPKKKKQTVIKKTQRGKLLPKRKKLQLKQEKLRLNRKKLQLKRGKPQPKRGNHPEPPKPVLKPPCNEFIAKVLRQMNQDKVCISTKAKGKMISFIKRFYKNVAEQAKRGKKFKHISTIGAKELQNALKWAVPKEQAMAMVRTLRKVSHDRRH